jgi:hypothetical protein
VNLEDKMALEHGTFAVDDVSLHYVKAGAGPMRSRSRAIASKPAAEGDNERSCRQ